MESEIQKNVRLMIKRLSPRLQQESGIQVDWEENTNDYIDILLKEKEKINKTLTVKNNDIYENYV